MNKNVKKFFSFLLCTVMVFSIFAVSVSAEDEKTKFKLSKSSDVVIGKQIDIVISVENAANLSMADLVLEYESGCFDYVDIVPADKNNMIFIGNEIQKGTVTISFIFDESISGSADIAVISLIPLTDDDSKISLHAITFSAEKSVEDGEFLLSETEIRIVDTGTSKPILKYEIVDDHAVITACDTTTTGQVEIPSEIDGYPVTEIALNAFAHCSQITRVVVPEGVTKIGYSAFMLCSRLAEITLPETLVNIEKSAFYMCGSLDNVVIPDGVTEIAEYTFYDCQNLKNITLPKNLKSIGKSAFAGSGLKTVEIPQSVTFIDSGAFIATGLKKVIIPEGITAIHSSTFKGCKNLVEVIIPDSVVSIGSDAFFGCSSMESITIPATVTEIGYMAVGYGENYFPISAFTICGYKNSKAESYALSNRIGFVAVDADPDQGKYDVNRDGKVTAADARFALRAAAKLEILEGIHFTAADINGDAQITASDARKILRKAAQLD